MLEGITVTAAAFNLMEATIEKIKELLMEGSFLAATLFLLALTYVITLAYMIVPLALAGALVYWLIYC